MTRRVVRSGTLDDDFVIAAMMVGNKEREELQFVLA